MTVGDAKRSWLFWGLIASGGINILMIGIFVGVLMHGPHMPMPHDVLTHMTRSMSDQDAKIMTDAFKGISDPRDVSPDLNQTHQRIREILIAPTVDEAALASAFDEEAVGRAKFESAIRSAFLMAAPKLSLDGRQRLVRNFDPH